MKKETKIQNISLISIGQRGDVLAWRQNVGKFRTLFSDEVVSCGIAGQGDIGMVVECIVTESMIGKKIGIAVNAEFKTETGRQSNEQKSWESAFKSRGGVYRVCRSADDLVALVDDVKNGKW